MQSLTAEMRVLEHEILVLRTLRTSDDLNVAEAAINRERKLQSELAALKLHASETPAEPDAPDYPHAAGFSMRKEEE